MISSFLKGKGSSQVDIDVMVCHSFPVGSLTPPGTPPYFGIERQTVWSLSVISMAEPPSCLVGPIG